VPGNRSPCQQDRYRTRDQQNRHLRFDPVGKEVEIAVLLAWGTIAGHAIRIARSNPVLALRYD
jgi:hypothetical protein